jgi:hypothetical protein
MLSDKERRDELLAVCEHAIAERQRWELSEMVKLSEELEDAVDGLVDTFAVGSLPSDCRGLAVVAEQLKGVMDEWRESMRLTRRVAPTPRQEFWRLLDRIDELLHAVKSPPKKPLESVAELRRQEVSDEQICKIYGWIDARGGAEVWKVSEELAKPGTHTGSNWTDPRERTRQEAERKRQEAVNRARAARERKLAKLNAPPPESLAELIAQGVTLGQIAKMHNCGESEILERCKAEGLPTPELSHDLEAGKEWQQDGEREAAEHYAKTVQAGQPVAVAEPEEPPAVPLAGSVEAQVIQLHLAGEETPAIVRALRANGTTLSAKKVDAILKRYQESPEEFDPEA